MDIAHILEKIRSEYAIAERSVLAGEIQEGYQSRNFILKNDQGKNLFLKQYRHKDFQRIEDIHRAKFFFSGGGIPVILPLRNGEGKYIFQASGRFYSLFPFIEGRIIRRRERSLKAFASAGRMLARLHALSQDGRFPRIGKEEKGWEKATFLEKAEKIRDKIGIIPQKTPFDVLALKTLDLKRHLVLQNDVRYADFDFKNDHLIHGDYYGGNMFYDDEDEVSHIFDIELAKVSPRVLEIARSIDYMCFSNEYGPKNFLAARCFLKAYESIYPLGKGELPQGIRARYLDKLHSLWIEEEHYLMGNTRVDCFLAGELEMLRYYSAFYDQHIRRLGQ